MISFVVYSKTSSQPQLLKHLGHLSRRKCNSISSTTSTLQSYSVELRTACLTNNLANTIDVSHCVAEVLRFSTNSKCETYKIFRLHASDSAEGKKRLAVARQFLAPGSTPRKSHRQASCAPVSASGWPSYAPTHPPLRTGSPVRSTLRRGAAPLPAPPGEARNGSVAGWLPEPPRLSSQGCPTGTPFPPELMRARPSSSALPNQMSDRTASGPRASPPASRMHSVAGADPVPCADRGR
jgi:hypothetical protein